MIITVQRRSKEIEQRRIKIGYMLTGLRITSMTVENREELKKLLSEDGQRWLARNALTAFVMS